MTTAISSPAAATATVSATKTNRRIGYERRVAEFIAAKGPDFVLAGVDFTVADGTNCDCCGKRNIHSLYRVRSLKDNAVHTIGCECQLFVLAVEQADLNAEFIRQMPETQLVRLALALGLQVVQPVQREALVKETLVTRRHLANKRAWVHRKANSAAVPVAAPAP